MKFLCLVYLDRGRAPEVGVMEQYQGLGKAMQDAGVIVDSGQLAETSATKTVRMVNDEPSVIDGPQSTDGDETARPIAYYLLERPSLDEALAWASRIPAATYGSTEVRTAH